MATSAISKQGPIKWLFKQAQRVYNRVRGERTERRVTPTDTVRDRYTWEFGDGSPKQHRPEAIHIYEQPGEYTIALTVSTGTRHSTQSKALCVHTALAPTSL